MIVEKFVPISDLQVNLTISKKPHSFLFSKASIRIQKLSGLNDGSSWVTYHVPAVLMQRSRRQNAASLGTFRFGASIGDSIVASLPLDLREIVQMPAFCDFRYGLSTKYKLREDGSTWNESGMPVESQIQHAALLRQFLDNWNAETETPEGWSEWFVPVKYEVSK